MDTDLRNNLRQTITTCREKLEGDFRLQLEGHYGIYTGKSLEQLINADEAEPAGGDRRGEIISALRHEVAQGVDLEDALERFVRESAFTTLNRLAALKLMEHPSRGLIQESIGRKDPT